MKQRQAATIPSSAIRAGGHGVLESPASRSRSGTGESLSLRQGGALQASARELNENLAALQGLLRQLVDQAEQKLSAIRAADAERMQGCTARETDLLEEVSRVGQARAAILAGIAQPVPGGVAPPNPSPG